MLTNGVAKAHRRRTSASRPPARSRGQGDSEWPAEEKRPVRAAGRFHPSASAPAAPIVLVWRSSDVSCAISARLGASDPRSYRPTQVPGGARVCRGARRGDLQRAGSTQRQPEAGCASPRLRSGGIVAAAWQLRLAPWTRGLGSWPQAKRPSRLYLTI
jgi:hypothetical protein